jgi:ABC-type Zn uptake system ZnuABC Zn-binding protein ZnuA
MFDNLRFTTLKYFLIPLLLIFALGFVSCNPESESIGLSDVANGGKIKVVATTTIVGDIVRQIGGDRITFDVLLPIGVDPHSYDATPQDIVLLSEADLIFVNGAGLESFIDSIIVGSSTQGAIINLSDEIPLHEFNFTQEHGKEQDDNENDDVTGDPHVWMDPNNVILWTHDIAAALSKLDPENQNTYELNAQTYREKLGVLDKWIIDQVRKIPADNRKIVTDHLIFGYFADRYGFEQVGAIFPGYSTLSEPSAQELAALVDTINQFNVKAVFVGFSVNPDLSSQVSKDTNTRLIFLYTGSLSEEDRGAGTYLDYMQYNVTEITNGLK